MQLELDRRTGMEMPDLRGVPDTVPGRDIAVLEQEVDRRRMAARAMDAALRVVAEGLGIPAALGVANHAKRGDDFRGQHGQKLSLRLRISAKTSTSDAFSMPRCFLIAGSAQRRNGLVASSSPIVVGSVGLPSARSASTFAVRGPQGRVVRIDGQRETGIGQRVFVAAIDQGVGGQGGELLQRFEHHRRRALEQPAAAHGKQRVGGEGHLSLRQMVADMAGGVAGSGDHLTSMRSSPKGMTEPSSTVSSMPGILSRSASGPMMRSL